MGKVSERIGVVGLGYVGLPVAAAFARVADKVVGFDVSQKRIDSLLSGVDWTGEMRLEGVADVRLELTSDATLLEGSTMFIVTVPTPVDRERRPDFAPLTSACDLIGRRLSRGSVVVFESTVYPGATEEICGPRLAQASGLRCGRDFTLAYSPERINPGDKAHALERIVKVVAAQDESTLERVASAYAAIVTAGIHRAPSIKVAEAAKVIENIQRDLNIALMNELSLIFDRLDIRTEDVLRAASTKWNFLKFSPGLVGGHCIGVDPYYLTAKAEAVGYRSEVILAGRRINDGMGRFIAQKTVKLLATTGPNAGRTRIGILGLTFKENVPDLRNSRVADIVSELRSFGIDPLVHDPLASPEEAEREHQIKLASISDFRDLDGLILAVAHSSFLEDASALPSMVRNGGVFVDVKSLFDPAGVRADLTYWSL